MTERDVVSESEPGAEVMERAEKAFFDFDDECTHSPRSGDCAAPHRCCRQCCVEMLLTFGEAERIAERERCAAEIPTNWCDPLLVGAASSLHGKPGTWDCQDIERLLRAVKLRLAPTPEEG